MSTKATMQRDDARDERETQPFIHPNALVETPHVGAGTRVWAFAHLLPGSVVGRDCNICDGVFIEGEATVGDRVTVKCGVQLWSGVTLEDDVFVGPNATFTNDPFPRSRQYPERFARTVVRRGASIGANATLLPGITIGQRAMVGAGAVVTRDVPEGAIVVGNPARVVGKADSREPTTHVQPDEHASRLDLARTIDIPEITDERGSLTFGQFDEHVPFVPVRYFTIMNVPSGTGRGGHAHKTFEEFIVALRGKVVVKLDDGTRSRSVVLDTPRKAVYVPPLVWIDLDGMSPETVILCLASSKFDQGDYLREYGAFTNYISSL